MLFGIGLTEAIRTYRVVLISMFMSDMEGQFDTSRGKHLKAIALVGFEGFLGKVGVVVLIHFDNFSPKYKNTPGSSQGEG